MPSHTKIDFVPARWWQVVDFMRLNLDVARGRDPMADRILSRPWALSSIAEYVYMLRRFLLSDAHFIVISGQRSGVMWIARWSDILFVITIGLFPRFQQHGIGTHTLALIEEHAKRQGCRAIAGAMAPSNDPIHRLTLGCDYHLLGLADTTLILSGVNPLAPPSNIEIREVNRAEATQAWKRWRLYEVELVAGQDGVHVAVILLKFIPLPRGRRVILYQDDQEIGFAYAYQRGGERTLGLFPVSSFWSGPETVKLIAALTSHLGSAIHRLTLTQTHANTLAVSAPFDFERIQESERHFMFKTLSSGED